MGWWNTVVVVQSPRVVWLCDPMDCSMPGLPVPHHVPKFAQVHVHWVSNAIQPSHPLTTLFSYCPQSFPASGTFLMSRLFTLGDQNTGASAEYSNEYSGLISLKTDWIDLLAPRDFQESFPAPQFEGISSSALCLLYSPALTAVRDHWEDHSLDYTDHCQHSNVSAFQHSLGLS